MRIRAVVTVALAALAVAVLMAMPALAAEGGTERPYKQSSTQTGTFNLTDEGFGQLDLDGPMIGSHLGKGSVRTVNTGEGNGGSIYTAANGDMLYSTEAEAPIPDIDCPAVPGFGGFGGPYPLSVTVTFIGGTGRFANVTGMAVSIGCFYFADFDPSDPDVDFARYPVYAKFSETGWLSY